MRAPRWRIVRRLRNGAAVDLPHPLMPGVTGFSLHAPDAETAIKNARQLCGRGDIEAISEVN